MTRAARRGKPFRRPKAHARAAALPVVLLILIVTCMLGLSAADLAVLDGKALHNAYDQEMAFQAAEAGLRDAELDIAGSPDAARSRSALFSADSAAGFTAACSGEGGIGLGLCLGAAEGAAPAWRQADFLAGDNGASSASAFPTVPYGSFTGRRMQTGTGALPVRPPRYLIELLADSAPGANADMAGLRYLYRITAMGFGAQETTQVMLQSFYRKESGVDGVAINETSVTGYIAGTIASSDVQPTAGSAMSATLGAVEMRQGMTQQEMVQEVMLPDPGAEGPAGVCPPLALPSALPVTRINAGPPGQAGRALLLSGLADGAPGLEAYDAANPERALFRFTAQDDPAIGSVSGAPVAALLQVEAGGNPAAYRRFAVVPGAGALFLLALDKDPLAPWQAGSNYFRLELPPGEDGAPSPLARPALLPDGGGAVRRAYAGDRQGRLWRFEFSPGWTRGGAAPPLLLFQASGPAGEPQPVSTRPALAFAPGGILVLFGTGDMHAVAPGIQSFYGIRDGAKLTGPVDRGSLSPRSLSDAGEGRLRIAGPSLRYEHSGKERQGWVIDFPQSGRSGERSVTDPVMLEGRLIFRTWIPASEDCGAGQMRTYVLDPLSGLTIGEQPTGSPSPAARPEPLLLVRTGIEAGVPDAFGRRMVRTTYAIRPPAAGAQVAGSAAAPMEAFSTETPAGRLAWREVSSHEALRQGLRP